MEATGAGKNVIWPDLSGYGAALLVVPKSPLRGAAITCLEVRDRALFQRRFGWPSDRDASTEEAADLKAKFEQAKRAMGFVEPGRSVYTDDAGDEGVRIRFFSDKVRFGLSDLQGLCPGLAREDLREFAPGAIRLSLETEQPHEAAWASFIDQVLQQEHKGVWTPIASAYDRPYEESEPLLNERYVLGNQPFGLIGRNQVPRRVGLPERLSDAHVRKNALVDFYADLASAQADGWSQAQLRQVDLPFALPLWITGAGRIIAVRDVRHASTLMDLPPERYFTDKPGGLIVSAIREAKSLAPGINIELDRWREWAAAPGKLEEPAALWVSIDRVVSAVAHFGERFPWLPTEVEALRAPVSAGGEALVTKPLDAWTSIDQSQLCRAVGRLVSLPVDDQSALASALGDAFKQALARQVEASKVSAKRQLRAVVQGVSDDGDVGDAAKVKHVDAGEKIGGARKDFARRAMTLDDLDSMNELEREAFVLKKNVWAPLDYPAMREQGVEASAAIGIKMLKDAIASAPDFKRDSRGEAPEVEYIKAVGRVRDAMAGVKTLDDFRRACFDLFQYGRGDSRYVSGGTAFQIAVGRAAASLLYDATTQVGWGDEATYVPCLPSKVASEIRKRGRKAAGYDGDATDEDLWSTLSAARTEKSDDRKAADKAKADQDRELHRPHLDHVHRVGEDWRQGRDVVADDLIEHFGFRAVEFGNWLPQGERQQVLNMAFDSLCDLAAALDLPPSGLSLDGELAVAFGSRGRGGVHAALAHFEPTRFVVNLTRMKGAGALAHEWGHAFDFHLGAKAGYASELAEGRTEGSVMGELAHALKYRPGDLAEIHEQASANAHRGYENTLSWLYLQDTATRQRLRESMEVVFENAGEAFKASATAGLTLMREGSRRSLRSDGAVDIGVQMEWKDAMLSTLRDGCPNRKGFTKVKDKIEGNLHYLVHHLSAATTIEAAEAMQFDLPMSFRLGKNARSTDYHENAQRLDKIRSTPYWATTREMFARACASYVHDQLADRGMRSDYLVYGSDEARYANHPVGNPNPAGEDRTVLATHFGQLMSEYRLRCVRDRKAVAGP